MKNKKVLTLVLITVFAILLIVGGSYAYWSWESPNNINVNYTIASDYSCSADGGGNITSDNIILQPASCVNTNYAIVRKITTSVTNSGIDSVRMDLWLNVNSLDSFLSGSDNFKWALSTSSSNCISSDTINSGNFKNKTAGDKVYLTGQTHSVTENNTYYLYIWLDSEETDINTAGKSFNFSLGGECVNSKSNEPNAPFIDTSSGLIPVKLSTSGNEVYAISKDNPEWYDYYNKKWANAVLVESTHRSGYQSVTRNNETLIPSSEILAYYVWLPRYSYQVWAYDGSDPAGNPREIPIKFVNTSTKDSATGNGQWYTHPAFTFGDTELSGIWVGKFETHHIAYTTTSGGSMGCSYSSCDAREIMQLRILPNVRPLTSNTVSSFFYASRAMEESSDAASCFGLDSDKIDTHMMKNSEWGAVSYLSHSKYGINDEIRINNTSNISYNTATRTFLTGCGAGTPNEVPEAACDIQYGTVSTGNYPQSTTGNVTGIFDMSGGANEYVMGTYNNSDSYSNTYSGFTSSNPLPDAKYYDNYANPPFDGTNSTDFTKCTLEYCGGHALNETKNWHSDYASIVISSTPWFMRGGNYGNGSSAGAFGVISRNGSANYNGSARLVLVENDSNTR